MNNNKIHLCRRHTVYDSLRNIEYTRNVYSESLQKIFFAIIKFIIISSLAVY